MSPILLKRERGLYCQKHPNNLVAVPTWHPNEQGLAQAGDGTARHYPDSTVASR